MAAIYHDAELSHKARTEGAAYHMYTAAVIALQYMSQMVQHKTRWSQLKR